MRGRVVIIVLNWNNPANTLECLASLAHVDCPPHEIVVVDNGSSDDSARVIRAAYPCVPVIETGDNLGYVGGNNVGLEYARTVHADYVLLLNNDTEVAPDFLGLLVAATETSPAVGVVGPTIYYFDQPDVIWSAGGAIDWSRGRTRMIGLDQVDQGQFGESPRPVDFVTGCALLARMSVVKQVGLLDPRFFAYYEETEWCVRVTHAGFKILHVPQARIWHKISPVAREAAPQVNYYMTRNRLLFLELTRAGMRPWLNTLFLDYGRTLVSWTLKPQWRNKTVQKRAMLHAILDYGRRQFGKMEVL